MITPLIKTLLGSTAIIVGFVGFIPYFRDMFAGKTKPHAFSWLVWAMTGGIAFVGQLVGEAGAGAWVTGTTTLIVFSVFLISLKKGEKHITGIDWLCLIGAFSAMLIWKITNEPLYALFLVMLIDFLGYIPTVIKSFYRPHEETLMTYFLAGLKYVFALFALENFILLTWLFPAFLVSTNFMFVGMVLWRRRKLKKKS